MVALYTAGSLSSSLSVCAAVCGSSSPPPPSSPIPYFSSFHCFISEMGAWNGGSWLRCWDLLAMGAVFYLGDGWPQWKTLGIQGTYLPLICTFSKWLIFVFQGGTHVNYVTDQIVEKLMIAVKRKNKGGIEVKPFQIKNHLWVFINCLIENPSFDSQTKENMTLRAKAFGSTCDFSDKFIKQVWKFVTCNVKPVLIKRGTLYDPCNCSLYKGMCLLNTGSVYRR